MLNWLRIFILFVIVFFSSVSVSEANYTFNELFNESSYTSWITLNDHITPQIINSTSRDYARFYSTSKRSFAYLAHKDIAESIVSVEFDFYPVKFTGSQGAGIMLTDEVPMFSQNPPNDSDKYSVGIWPIKGDYYLVSTLCDFSESCNLPAYYRALYKLDNNVWSNIKIMYYSDLVEVVLNDSQKILEYGGNSQPAGLYIGNPVIATRDQSWSDFYVDNLSIEYGSTLPFWNNFPFLSQMDSRWAGVEYDTASSWAPINERGIDRWGCALTSAAMVLQNYNVKMPDGAVVLPNRLNTWLLGNNGYVGPGLVNWLAITRLAKESFEAGQADTKLEFVRTYTTADMKYPAILGLDGHFVVAHNQLVPNWRINDPALNTGDTTLPMSTTIKSVNRFIPSNTDLSYLLFTSNSPLAATLKTATGSATTLSWTDEYLTDDIGGTSGPTMYTAMVPKPQSGVYDLLVQNNGDTPENIMVYMYDKEGLTKTENLDLPLGETNFTINYNKSDSADSEVVPVDNMAPETPKLLLPTNGSLRNYVDLVLKWDTVTDPSTPVRYEYRSGDISGSTTSRQLVITDWADGSYSWSVRACDSASNCSPWSEDWSFTIDNTAPQYVNTTAFDGWHMTTQTAFFNYSDSHLKSDYVPPSCEINTEGLESYCSIDPRVCDELGNCNTDTQKSNLAKMDLSLPISLFTLPSTITNWDGKIAGTASDKVSGIQKVELKITFPDMITTTTTAVGTENWEYLIPNPPGGLYTIYAIATDHAGHTQNQEMQITTTNSIPTIKLPNPPSLFMADDFDQIIIGGWRPVKGIRKYHVFMGLSENEMKPVAETKYSWWISNRLTKGKYYLGVKSVDKNDNESIMSKIVKVEIRQRLPWWR